MVSTNRFPQAVYEPIDFNHRIDSILLASAVVHDATTFPLATPDQNLLHFSVCSLESIPVCTVV